YEVGNSQSICVGSAHYFNKPDTLVLVAYIGKTQIATIEIALSDCHIIQCRAFANGVCEYQDRIAKIISDNKKLIDERKRA
ncbi:MAG: PcfJ domain-containing protein, partial [Lachnospiraceae bacterium]|nr:PcfJ domain-containing protein [Lachnospiraceae bacterium]